MAGAMARIVEPEWLDVLPSEDPRARRSRRDLARVNALMANSALVARSLRRARPAGVRSLAEIGAGDGRFALRLARALPRPARAVSITLVDRQALVGAEVAAALAARGWAAAPVQADVFAWLEGSREEYDAIVANLFLHHFERAALARLLRLASERTRVFVACEPRRSALALAGSRLLGAIGCNDVTRHDAVASVRAGFTAAELCALWPGARPGATQWRLTEARGALFSHCFAAVRP